MYLIIGEYKNLAISTIEVDVEVFDLKCLIELDVMYTGVAIQFNFIVNNSCCIVD